MNHLHRAVMRLWSRRWLTLRRAAGLALAGAPAGAMVGRWRTRWGCPVVSALWVLPDDVEAERPTGLDAAPWADFGYCEVRWFRQWWFGPWVRHVAAHPDPRRMGWATIPGRCADALRLFDDVRLQDGRVEMALAC